jgi:SAM-dependent methyltransferase
VAQAEFDSVARSYYELHKQNIEISGEAPEYFAEYKIRDLARVLGPKSRSSLSILDFGSGIGNSIPHLRSYFPAASLTCTDVSSVSHDVAQERFPGGKEQFLLIEDDRIPVPDASQDVVFSACVFHHIDAGMHADWLAELRRITRPGGLLAIYEHNPLNPLTVRVFNDCPFDQDAHMIRAGALKRACAAAGWLHPSIRYRLFFPRAFAAFRPLERGLGWLFLGAQYLVLAER